MTACIYVDQDPATLTVERRFEIEKTARQMAEIIAEYDDTEYAGTVEWSQEHGGWLVRAQ